MRQQPERESLPYDELPLGLLDSARVEALWRYHPGAPRRQTVLPDGRMDLVAHAALGDGASGRITRVSLAIAGPADRPTAVAHRAPVCSMGVRFQLGWGGACLSLEPATLVNQVLSGPAAEQALGPLAAPLLAATDTCALQAALVAAAAALAHRAGPAPAANPSQARALQALRWLRQHPGAPLHALCATLDLPERTLRRDMLAAVGLPLRSLAGILRFQRAMALLQGGAQPSLAHLAHEAGYADQAHMTRQFRKLGGFTPALPQPVPVVA
ncbi:MAG: AraC family transcriptional regulator [Pseudomonadota bacterium]